MKKTQPVVRGRKGAPTGNPRSAKAAANQKMNPIKVVNPYKNLPPAAPSGYRGQNAPKATPQRGQFIGQNAPQSAQQQAQRAARRRIDDNTRYQRGKKHPSGFYESYAGEYDNARRIGAL